MSMIFVDCDSNYNKLFNELANSAFNILGLKGEAAVEVCIVDKEQIRNSNKTTRNIDKVTDVLSYPMVEQINDFTKDNYPYDYDDNVKAVYIGCIMICDDVAAEQAVEYGHSFSRELGYLFLHGLLHVLGYDHMTEEDKAKMRDTEEKIMSAVNLRREA